MNAIVCSPPPNGGPTTPVTPTLPEPSHDSSTTINASSAPKSVPRTNSTRQLPTYATSTSRILTPAETYAPSPTLGTWKIPEKDTDIDLNEDTSLLFKDSGFASPPCSTGDSKARRKWMKDSENRHSVVFKKDRVYDMEIYAP
jgi:hypothetical protein